MKHLIPALAVCIFAFGCVHQSCSEVTKHDFAVVRVIDGDTFTIFYDGEETRVRLADYYAPEKNEEGGAEATQALRDAIGGKVVTLRFPGSSKRDHYGRLLALVFVNGRQLHLTLPQGGRGYTEPKTQLRLPAIDDPPETFRLEPVQE